MPIGRHGKPIRLDLDLGVLLHKISLFHGGEKTWNPKGWIHTAANQRHDKCNNMQILKKMDDFKSQSLQSNEDSQTSICL